MANRDIEARLNKLAEHRSDPTSTAGVAAIRAALGDRSNVVAASAAKLVGEGELSEHGPTIAAGLERWLSASPGRDKTARAKTAFAEAARALRLDVEELFIRGAHTRQPEPVWGGSVDVAAELRGICGMALAAEDHPESLDLIADLLADPEPQARIAGARAVAALGRPAGLPLLRLRAQLPDDDPRVAEECFAALLALDPGESLEFVTRLLLPPPGSPAVPPETQEAAALALGESRVDGALSALVAWSDRLLDPNRRPVAWTAIAMLRSPAAWDHLVRQVATAHLDDAHTALRALAPWSHDETLAARVLDAAEQRGDRALCEAAKRLFDE